MPYIKQMVRDTLDRGEREPQTPGELSYVITDIIDTYLFNRTLYLEEYSYTDLNDILGALEGAKLEFYRRVVVPYEEQKRKENGDVYGL